MCNGRAGVGRALRVCGFVGLLPQLETACIDLYQTESVGKGSDHLQLVKFWLSAPPGRGSAVGGGEFGSALL